MRTIQSVVVVLLVALGLVVHTGPSTTGAASARASSSPVLKRPVTSATAVVFKGRARPKARVRLEVRKAQRWVTVDKDRSNRRGRYRMVVNHPKRTRAYRVVSGRRASRVRTVAPQAAQPTPRVAAKPAPPRDDCGVRPARPAGGRWSCTLVDDFSGTTVDRSVWTGLDKVGSGDQCVVAHPDTIAVSGGSLRLAAQPTNVARGLTCPVRADGTRGKYASAWLSSVYKWGQQYGRFEARMKVKDVGAPGLHEAFWLWPDTRTASDKAWPASGEIDIVETYSAYPKLAVPFLHYNADDNGGPVPGLNTAHDCHAPRGEWHTYTLEWTADELRILVDGKVCLVNTDGAATMRKAFIINFTQFLGGPHNDFHADRVDLPATMLVDYVKVWE